MKKETSRPARKTTFIAALLFVSLFLIIGMVLFLTTDIYINRPYLAARHFSKAFNARITGNCEVFYEFILKDVEGWKNKCVAEKKLMTDPFYEFKVLRVTTRGDQAFIQAELVRGANRDVYPVSYEMKLVNGRWLINQFAN
jgi:hypothetical protein